MRATTRVGASVCLSVFSLVSIVLLLPSTRMSTQLQKITLGTDFPTLWNWGEEEEEEYDGEGIRLVVFGDSWVDDRDDSEKKGSSWAAVLCEEIQCTSRQNFAVSQAIEAYPSSAPAGAITSNEIYLAANPPVEFLSSELLPDLAAQVQQFIALPPPTDKPKETLFLFSFGFWDIYNFASLDLPEAKSATDKTINEFFDQIDVIYSHYSQSLSTTHPIDAPLNITYSAHPQPFRIILPKVFEPSLLPGWISARPKPLAPSSVAEHQKNAAYITNYWNVRVEDRIRGWVKEELTVNATITNTTTLENELVALPAIERDVFYYDLAQYLLDVIVEHQLEDEGLSDANGLGKGESPFESVYEPCVRENSTSEYGADLNGQMICDVPEDYLFWDSFNLGCVAKANIGKEVAGMVKSGKSMKETWGKKNGWFQNAK